MASEKSSLTTQKLSEKFSSNFELVNYAIKLAKGVIDSGRECIVPTDVQNPAFWVLLEILNDKDKLNDITGFQNGESSAENSVIEACINKSEQN